MKFYLLNLIFLLGACSQPPGFQGSNANSGEKKVPQSNAIGASHSPFHDDSLFASSGNSLDAYLVVDVSGSLKDNDPQCLRYEGIKKFRRLIMNIVGSNADARATLVTFAKNAKFNFTDNDFLKTTDSDFDLRYRDIICSESSGTNTKESFDVAIAVASELMKKSPKDKVSMLLFTDGEPTVGTEDDLLSSTEKLKNTFPNRIFSLLLGSPSEKGKVLKNYTPVQFMELVSGSPQRTKQVLKVEDIDSAFNSFLGL